LKYCKSLSAFVFFLIVLTSLLLPSCTPSVSIMTPDSKNQRDVLMQVSTIDALVKGIYDGVITACVLKRYGDFGIGTFEGLDGEMVLINGDVYQVKGDGRVGIVSDEMMISFATVTFFDSDTRMDVPKGMNLLQFMDILDDAMPTPNAFYAIRADGHFNYIKTRSVPKQQKPYPVLTEVTKNQAVFEYHNVEGTLIGFKSPPYVSGVNLPGYHVHFITDDRTGGGHVLDFTTSEVTALLDYTTEFFMMLPGMDSDFYRADFNKSAASELEKAEK